MSNETARKEETNAITKPAKSPVVTGNKYNRQAVIAIAVAVLFVFAIAAGGFSLWREIKNTNAALENQVGDLRQKENTADAEIQRLGNKDVDLLQQIQDLQTRNEAMNIALKQIHRQPGTDNIEFALAEVEYLLIMASQRLTLQKDVTTALAAMEAADRRLEGLDAPRITEVRGQLVSDINRLRSVNTVDITGLALYLADLIQRVEQIPVKNNIHSMPEADSVTGPAADTDGWRHVASLIWQELKSLIVISRDQEISPVRLLPDETYFLYHNLRIELANARLAVFNRDTDNLQASLDNIIDWLNRYFDTREAAVSNILNSLQQMRSLQIDPELPDISSSLETVRAYIRSEDEDMTSAPVEDRADM